MGASYNWVMPMRQQDEKMVKDLCTAHNYIAARDFLYGKKREYENSNSVLRHSYFLHLGKCLTRLGEYDKAESYLNQSLDASPWSINTKLAQVDLFIQQGSLKKAETALIEILDNHRNKEDIFLHKILGRFFKITGRYSDALDCLKKVESQLQGNSHAITQEITFLQKILSDGKADPFAGLATYSFHLAKNLSTSIEQKQRNLGVVFLETQIKEEKDPIRKSALYSLLSRIHFEHADYHDAEKSINSSLALNPKNKHAISNQICLYLATDRNDEAKQKSLDANEAIHNDPNIMIRLAFAFQKAGTFDLAHQFTERALVLDGNNPDIKMPAANILQRIANNISTTPPSEPVFIVEPNHNKVCALLRTPSGG